MRSLSMLKLRLKGGALSAHQELHVDSYFHADVMSSIDGSTGDEVLFDPATESSGFCSHVDANISP